MFSGKFFEPQAKKKRKKKRKNAQVTQKSECKLIKTLVSTRSLIKNVKGWIHVEASRISLDINIIMKLREGKKQVCIGALSANATIFLWQIY